MTPGTADAGRTDPDEERTRAAPLDPRAIAADALPERIGKYRIRSRLGEGGMGAVYEAEQEQPRRTVALKVIRAGQVSAASLRRFEYESEVLGRLQHPGIAQVFEAGTIVDRLGQHLPFFAMELIRGEELDTFAERRRLDTGQRLELIARICDAVDHAHQKGVIHRDLKPGNILVDASGQPKILDFGVARATDADMQRTTMRTDVGEIVGTIPYMSPEQVSGDPGLLDTRSDVYALGVIAYELLAGRMPYDLTKRAIHEALRTIREEEPTRLSRIHRHLRGDVETIVGKALEKEKTRRYQSAEAFAADIRRHLANEPIAARPASTWYHAAKFARRHKGLVTGLALAMVLLVAGLVGVSFALHEAVAAGEREVVAREAAQRSEGIAVAARADEEKQRARAESDRDKSAVIANFLVTTLGAVEAATALGRDTTLLEAMLDSAAQRIENGELAGAPEAELFLRGQLGPSFVQISKPEKARRLLEPALATHRAKGVESKEMVLVMVHLALARQQLGDVQSAIPLQVEAIAMFERIVPGDSSDLALFLSDLGLMRMDAGDSVSAEATLRRAVDTWRRSGVTDGYRLAKGLDALGVCLMQGGKLEPAEAILREALAATASFPQDNPSVAATETSLGHVLRNLGRIDEAEQILRTAVDRRRRLYRGDHELLAGSLSSLSAVLLVQKNLGEAEALARESLAMYQRIFSGDHARVAGQLNNVGHLLQQKGDLDGAESMFRNGLAMSQRLFPEDHPGLPPLQHNLACLLQAKHDFAGAEPLFREALMHMQRLFPKGHPNTALILFNLANDLRDAGDLVQAEQLHRDALAMRRALFPKGHFSIEQSLFTLGRLLQQRGDEAGGEAMLVEAKELRSKLGLKPR
ncbi:MAG: serine/threonine protein kinase [Planctomycetes bacterium]|nr:serine/threonine protein kinase [Planctomycetota bacterium]